MGCALCHQHAGWWPWVQGLPSSEVLTPFSFPLLGLLYLISACGAELKTCFLSSDFLFPALCWGALLPAPQLGAQWPLQDVPASCGLFSPGILALISPFDFSLFEAQGLDVFQGTLKSDMKTLEAGQNV